MRLWVLVCTLVITAAACGSDGGVELGRSDQAGGDSASTSSLPEGCPAFDGSSPTVTQFDAPPPLCIDPTTTYIAEMSTNHGPITITLDPAGAPNTVNSFVVLALSHYFDGTMCHRVVPDFVIQCGDPTATGTGGPGYEFADELPAEGAYQIGSVAMANSGPDTNGSQFFIISGEQGAALPPLYSLFGQVSDGLDTVATIDALGVGDGPPSEDVIIESVTVRPA